MVKEDQNNLNHNQKILIFSKIKKNYKGYLISKKLSFKSKLIK